jgi:dTDP-4-amino-4,6-dideoxygalactose transaminase
MPQASSIDTITLPSDQDASGRTLGSEEKDLLAEVINSGTLTSTKGQFVKQLETDFAGLTGSKHALACASGTAAIHCAVVAIDPEPGDEIITTPITDMGGLSPIVYQGAIPVFADVDDHSLNVTAETIEPRISDKTRAIIVTHLFGNPCDMNPILELAKSHDIPIIEDCAQAYGATYDGVPVGKLGTIGCFSLQQGKHITTGEGGLVTTDDDELARRMYLFINKAWGYGDPDPDHYFLALNYRMTELQGAVAVAQMRKLASVVSHRIAMADRLTKKLEGIEGIRTPSTVPDGVHTYWKYCLQVDPDLIPGGAVALGAALKDRQIFTAPRYIQKPAFRCEVFADQRTFGNSRFPFTLARPEAVDYSEDLYPGSFLGLERVLVLPWNERLQDEHVDYMASSIKEAVTGLRSEDS